MLLSVCLAVFRWLSDFEAQLLTQNVSALNGTWLDVPAAIDYFLITEVTKNPGACVCVCVCAVPDRRSAVPTVQGAVRLLPARLVASVVKTAARCCGLDAAVLCCCRTRLLDA